MRLIYTILIISLGIGCSPQKRLSRLVRNHPELIRTDTVWRTDTVIVAGTRQDTSFYFYQKDTVIVKKDQLTMKYYFRSDSTIYLEGECDTVTVIREIPIQVNTITPVASIPWYERWIPWIIVAACLYFAVRQRGQKP